MIASEARDFDDVSDSVDSLDGSQILTYEEFTTLAGSGLLDNIMEPSFARTTLVELNAQQSPMILQKPQPLRSLMFSPDHVSTSEPGSAQFTARSHNVPDDASSDADSSSSSWEWNFAEFLKHVDAVDASASLTVNNGKECPPSPGPPGVQRTHRIAEPLSSPLSEQPAVTSETTEAKAMPVAANPPFTHWVKLQKLGEGGFGQVFLGQDIPTGALMAVKTIPMRDESEWKEKLTIFQREVATMQAVQNCKHCVRYLGCETTRTSFNIFLEYVSGGSLQSVYKRLEAPMYEVTVRKYTREMLLGLAHLHEQGIVHRDIKCANVLLDSMGTVKLADFGSSKLAPSSGDGKGTVSRLKGTPLWMAPEVLKGGVPTKEADIWSVGCTVLEMVTASPPWGFTDVYHAVYEIGQAKSGPPVPDHLSPELRQFLAACFQINPADRPSCRTLLQSPWILTWQPPETPKREPAEPSVNSSMTILTSDISFCSPASRPPLGGTPEKRDMAISTLGTSCYGIAELSTCSVTSLGDISPPPTPDFDDQQSLTSLLETVYVEPISSVSHESSKSGLGGRLRNLVHRMRKK